MAKVENYRITYGDGTETFLQLDEQDAEQWQKWAKDDNNDGVKSVTKADPQPFNAESGGRRAASQG